MTSATAKAVVDQVKGFLFLYCLVITYMQQSSVFTEDFTIVALENIIQIIHISIQFQIWNKFGHPEVSWLIIIRGRSDA